MTKLLFSAFAGLALLASVSGASAQAGDTCADYLKADAQAQAALSAQDKAMLQADKTAAAIDEKMRAYCKANPKASTSEAAMKAMQ